MGAGARGLSHASGRPEYLAHAHDHPGRGAGRAAAHGAVPPQAHLAGHSAHRAGRQGSEQHHVGALLPRCAVGAAASSRGLHGHGGALLGHLWRCYVQSPRPAAELWHLPVF